MNKSSWDAAFEALMVEKLRMQCGVNEKEVSRMGKMFTDMALSIDLENKFKKKYPSSSLGGIKF